MTIQVPRLIELIKTRVASTPDEEEVKRFFNTASKPNKTWLGKLEPGIDASQRILSAYMSEQSTGDPGAFAEDDERRALIEELFGKRCIEIMRELRHVLASNKHARLDLMQDESGQRIGISAPKPEIKESRIAEPPEGLIPGPVVPGSSLQVLIEAMKGKLRLDGPGEATIEQILEAVATGKWSRKVVMLVPCNKDVNPNVMFPILAQIRKQPWMGFEYITNTVIQRARNLLAQLFLRSEAEWSLWHDSDMVLPFGDSAFFYDRKRLGADPNFILPKFTAVMTVERLMKAQKTIIGGVYQARRNGEDAPLIIQPHLHPRDAADKELVALLKTKGPQDIIKQVGYVATGCAMIHRSVYRDIMQAFPERQPANPEEPYDFFGESHGGEQGEDIFFCGLAQKAGHASFLDCGLWAAHLGTAAFFPTKQTR